MYFFLKNKQQQCGDNTAYLGPIMNFQICMDTLYEYIY
jgi:hypothetical protein